jgi:hypothetical protein
MLVPTTLRRNFSFCHLMITNRHQRYHLQSSKKENSRQGNLALLIHLQLPNHGQRHAQNKHIPKKAQKAICKANDRQCVIDAMTSFYGLVPKVVDRSTLKSTGNPCSDCPEERVDPYTPCYFFEDWRIKYSNI